VRRAAAVVLVVLGCLALGFAGGLAASTRVTGATGARGPAGARGATGPAGAPPASGTEGLCVRYTSGIGVRVEQLSYDGTGRPYCAAGTFITTNGR